MVLFLSPIWYTFLAQSYLDYKIFALNYVVPEYLEISANMDVISTDYLQSFLLNFDGKSASKILLDCYVPGRALNFITVLRAVCIYYIIFRLIQYFWF